MSAFAASQLAVLRATPEAEELNLLLRGVRTVNDRGEKSGGGGLIGYVGQIAAYIPTEGIAFYLGAAALAVNVDPAPEVPKLDPTVLWIGFGLALAINVVVATASFISASRANEEKVVAWRLLLVVGVVLVLSVLYVWTMPENPLLAAFPVDLRILILVAAVVALALPWLAPRIGLQPRHA